MLWLLRTYIVAFKRDGVDIAVGCVEDVEDGSVVIKLWNTESGLHDGEELTLNIFSDFDEVMYL